MYVVDYIHVFFSSFFENLKCQKKLKKKAAGAWVPNRLSGVCNLYSCVMRSADCKIAAFSMAELSWLPSNSADENANFRKLILREFMLLLLQK
jgi:hypothetical protein